MLFGVSAVAAVVGVVVADAVAVFIDVVVVVAAGNHKLNPTVRIKYVVGSSLTTLLKSQQLLLFLTCVLRSYRFCGCVLCSWFGCYYQSCCFALGYR
jgi:hypothetical protein